MEEVASRPVLDFTGFEPMKAYTVPEAARLSGISKYVIYRAIRAGRLEACSLWGSKAVYVRGEELRRAYRKGLVKVTPEEGTKEEEGEKE